MWNELVIIGLGGTGSYFLDPAIRCLVYREKAPKKVLLIDGGVYKDRNMNRQFISKGAVGENKAQLWASLLSREFGRELSVRGVGVYVGAKTKKAIPSLENSIIVAAVDNYPARNYIAGLFAGLENAALIMSGNEAYDEKALLSDLKKSPSGSVLSCLRRKGKYLMPPVTAFHDEIAHPVGKNPADLSCEEIAKMDGGQQIIRDNFGSAYHLLAKLLQLLEGHEEEFIAQTEIYYNSITNVSNVSTRYVDAEMVEMPKRKEETVLTALELARPVLVAVALSDKAPEVLPVEVVKKPRKQKS